MEELIIQPTSKTLAVNCSPGKLNFKGCSITNDPRVFFKPIKDWIKDYVKKPQQQTEVSLDFEYIDTASVKFIYQILQDLKIVQASDYGLKVNWYYDIQDPEILELGEILQSKLDIEFSFIDQKE